MLVLAATSGCGGGGGGGAPPLPLTLSFSPSPLTATYTQHSPPAGIGFGATVTGTVSNTTIYVLVSDSAATFDTNAISVSQVGPQDYSALLRLVSGLPVGIRNGTLDVQLCGTQSCSGSLLGHAGLPYTVTVNPDPPPVLEYVSPVDRTYLAGSSVALIAGMSGYVPDTQTLYARVQDADGIFTAANPLALNRSGSEFTSTFQLSSGAAEGSHRGTLDVTVCGDSGCSSVIGTRHVTYDVYVAKIIAGIAGTAGGADGPGASATFNYPVAVVMDASNNVFVATINNFAVRKVDTAGTVSTVAVIGGYANGIARASDGTLLVSDSFHCVIKRVNVNGTVDTVAGFPDTCYQTNGLNSPAGLALDTDSSGYVVDQHTYVVRHFVAGTQNTTTLAGSYQQMGTADGNGANARFGGPSDVARDSAGNLYVVDDYNHVIRRITPAGDVTTFAGTAGRAGYVDGVVGQALFHNPWGITIDSAGNLYVADSGNQAIRKVTPAGEVITLIYGLTLPNGQLMAPYGIDLSSDGHTLVVSDPFNNVIVRTSLP